ncbi:N-acetyltransferase GCN5 [Burkholderia cepacia GG4]|uniref:N-acetyltransferase GCN5 n=1 Tax=Burkholderia cepacia GG4 TaxID=1009846 RepID=A0A9W3K339_BURCE|nr:N-acetyltransferase GCN5 [Burkholderia cepacia GG4]
MSGYAWTDQQVGRYPLSSLCGVLSVSVNGYRAWKRGGKPGRTRLTDTQLLTLIRTIHAEVIRSVSVAEHLRRSGLGKSIVSYLLTACRTHAVPSVVLLTTTAEEYFAGHGFVRVARHEVPHPLPASSQFQGVCPGSATAMLKAL